jgi:hypothetical protein
MIFLLTSLDILGKEIAIQQVLQLHDNLRILHWSQLGLNLPPDEPIQLLRQDHLDTFDEAYLIDCSPWQLFGRRLAAVDVAGEGAKSGEDLGIWSRVLVARKVEHLMKLLDFRQIVGRICRDSFGDRRQTFHQSFLS